MRKFLTGVLIVLFAAGLGVSVVSAATPLNNRTNLSGNAMGKKACPAGEHRNDANKCVTDQTDAVNYNASKSNTGSIVANPVGGTPNTATVGVPKMDGSAHDNAVPPPK